MNFGGASPYGRDGLGEQTWMDDSPGQTTEVVLIHRIETVCAGDRVTKPNKDHFCEHSSRQSSPTTMLKLTKMFAKRSSVRVDTFRCA